MTVRLLRIDEWERVNPLILREFGEKLPPPTRARVVVLEEAGEIVGFTVLQYVLHMEPTWIDPRFAATLGATRMLARKVLEVAPEDAAVAHVTNDRIMQLMQSFGWEYMREWRAMRWVRSLVASK